MNWEQCQQLINDDPIVAAEGLLAELKELDEATVARAMAEHLAQIFGGRGFLPIHIHQSRLPIRSVTADCSTAELPRIIRLPVNVRTHVVTFLRLCCLFL